MPSPDLRWLPSVDAVLRHLGATALPRPTVVAVARRVLAGLRENPPSDPTTGHAIAAVCSAVSDLARRRLRPVINATGVVLHTNLGRAPMSDAAAAAVHAVATRYNTLEYDLAAGERGRRAEYLEHNLAVLCDAPAATVVNNCAAALVLILRTFAAKPPRTEVIISRGELVQIGGGFRVPDILAASGATLREVGTTNQTSIDDYRRALNDRTAMILKVHRSNFYQGGFVAEPSGAELASLAQGAAVPFVEDVGSGATFDTAALSDAAEREPTPAAVLAAGADLVCFSGDKLLAGPQAGIIAGRADLVSSVKREPFFRALRCDKMVLAALEVTIDSLLSSRPTDLPARAMLHASPDALRPRAEAIAAAFADSPIRVRVADGLSRVGGGTLPRTQIPSIVLAVSVEGQKPNVLAARLRENDPPVIGHVESGRLTLDLRTVFADQDIALTAALRALAGGPA